MNTTSTLNKSTIIRAISSFALYITIFVICIIALEKTQVACFRGGDVFAYLILHPTCLDNSTVVNSMFGGLLISNYITDPMVMTEALAYIKVYLEVDDLKSVPFKDCYGNVDPRDLMLSSCPGFLTLLVLVFMLAVIVHMIYGDNSNITALYPKKVKEEQSSTLE
jgi:hypothetical protein